MTETPQPHYLETEQHVLACMFNRDGDFERALSLLSKEDFYLSQHQVIFDGFLRLQEKHKNPCAVALYDYVKARGHGSTATLSYIMLIANLPVAVVSLEDCVEILKEKRVGRSIYNMSKAHMSLTNTGEGLDELMEKMRLDYSNLEKEGMGDYGKELIELAQEGLEELERRIDLHRRGIRSSGLSTGFDRFDDMVGGLSPSHLIIGAGRPGMGKTAFALNILENLVFKYKRPVGFFSLEMSHGEVFDRLISSQTSYPLKKIRTGCLDDHELQVVKNKVADIRNLPFIIDDAAYQTIASLSSKAMRMKSKYNIEAIIIDYLQLLHGTKKGSADNRYMEVTEISRKLKCLAKHLNIPVICLSQLSRSVEQRPSKVPQLSDLRESGSIEQDADIVFFLYRGDYYDPYKGEDSKIIIAKNRHGQMGDVDVTFNKYICQFKEKPKEKS